MLTPPPPGGADIRITGGRRTTPHTYGSVELVIHCHRLFRRAQDTRRRLTTPVAIAWGDPRDRGEDL